jgi:hypothetical protein
MAASGNTYCSYPLAVRFKILVPRQKNTNPRFVLDYIDKMITYLYYRVFKYFETKDIDIKWQKWRALIVTSFILIANLLTLLFFLNSIFYNSNLLLLISSGNDFIDKYVIYPLLILPVFAIIYYLGYMKLDSKLEYFESGAIRARKKKDNAVLIYLIISFILFTISFFSPLFIH